MKNDAKRKREESPQEKVSYNTEFEKLEAILEVPELTQSNHESYLTPYNNLYKLFRDSISREAESLFRTYGADHKNFWGSITSYEPTRKTCKTIQDLVRTQKRGDVFSNLAETILKLSLNTPECKLLREFSEKFYTRELQEIV
ncbi:MAG: hypothetical protein ACNA7Y_05660, partial [Gammaproteobacteria bacterium]